MNSLSKKISYSKNFNICFLILLKLFELPLGIEEQFDINIEHKKKAPSKGPFLVK